LWQNQIIASVARDDVSKFCMMFIISLC
jgi:hypothetical protein